MDLSFKFCENPLSGFEILHSQDFLQKKKKKTILNQQF